MFGSGIGELNVYIRTIGSTSDPDKKIWGLNGDAGNNWYMAQAPVASSRPFKVHIFFLIVLGSFLHNLHVAGLKQKKTPKFQGFDTFIAFCIEC